MENSVIQDSGNPQFNEGMKSFAIIQPETDESVIPLLIDSPHSGRVLPDNFKTSASNNALLSGWDAWIDELFGDCSYFGATLIHQHISRMVIDLNRKYDDINPELLSDNAATSGLAINPSAYSTRGMGLIRQFALPGIPVSEGKLSAQEVKSRIDDYYFPYHNAIESKLTNFRQRFGAAWHIDCHSMKSIGNAMNIDAGLPRADIVLSDRDGATGDPALMNLMAYHFRDLGYQVALNNPYKGGYLVQAYSDPQNRIYSMQIELNRALYMNEQAFSKKTEYEALKADINNVLQQAANYIKQAIS